MNIKELFSKDRFNKKKFVEFFDKKGFYVVLVFCIAIVGATAVFVTTRNISSSKNDGTEKVVSNTKDSKTAVDVSSKAVAQSSTTSTDKETVANAVTGATKSTQPGTASTEASKNAKTSDVAKAADASKDTKTAKASVTQSTTKAAPADPGFENPVFGQITYDYSKDKLAYSKTLDQWMTHNGLDIASERGSQVKAAADGIVSDIKNDPRLGVVVVLDHQNGYKTMYGNLAADDMVTVNLKVKKGEVIGSIGNTALYEVAEAPHLHFEVLKNNVSVDPKTYLPKN